MIDAATPGAALQQVLALGWCRYPEDGRRLLAAAAGVEPGRLSLLDASDFTDAVVARFLEYVERRNHGEPVSHILGYRDFWSYRFRVTGDVLDPRPETEVLVAAALEEAFARVLDLGTGSGAILLTLLAERAEATGVATDLSEAALEIARQNAEALGVAGRCEMLVSDWWAAVEGQFDLIVSNPPYIAADEMGGLSQDLSFEPRMALTDEADGLSAYRAICDGVGAHLRPGGRLMVEIGPTQGAAVAGLVRKAGLENVEIRPDLDGRNRVVIGTMPR